MEAWQVSKGKDRGSFGESFCKFCCDSLQRRGNCFLGGKGQDAGWVLGMTFVGENNEREGCGQAGRS